MNKKNETHITMDWNDVIQGDATAFPIDLLYKRYVRIRSLKIRPHVLGGQMDIVFKDRLADHRREIQRRFTELVAEKILRHAEEMPFFGKALTDDGYEIIFPVPPEETEIFPYAAMKVLKAVLRSLGIDPLSTGVRCVEHPLIETSSGWITMGTHLREKFFQA